MPTIQHNVLTTTELHEPKGVDAASAAEVYVADGVGSGSWQLLNPYGGIIYNDVAGSGTTISTPSTYTLVNPTTAATNLEGFSTNNAGRLTYTGANTRHFHAVFDASYKHTTGSGQDIFFSVYENGSLLGSYEAAGTADSSNFQRMVLHFDVMSTTNDYYEVYVKTASGSVVIHGLYFFMMGMPS